MMSLKNKLKFIATPSRILATGIVLLMVIHILQLFAFEISREIEYDMRRKAQQKKQTPQKLRSKEDWVRDYSKEFMPDGTLLFVSVVMPKNNRSYYDNDEDRRLDDATIKIYDKDAKDLWEGKYKDRPYRYLQWPQGINAMGRMDRMNGYKFITPELSQSLEVPIRENQKLLQMWRFNWERQYFEGFAAGGERIGFVGSEGFSESKANVVPLGDIKAFTAWCPEATTSPTLLLITDRRLYQFDFENQNFETLFETTDSYIDYNMIAWKNWRSGTYAGDVEGLEYRPSIQIKTSDSKYYLIMKEPKEILTFEVPEDWRDLYVRMLATNKGIFVKNLGNSRWAPKKYRGSIKMATEWYKQQEGKPIRSWTNLYKLNAAGEPEFINRYEWTLPAGSFGRTVVAGYDESLSGRVQRYASTFTPLVYTLPAKLCNLYGYEKLRMRRSRLLKFDQGMDMVYPYRLKLNAIVSAVMALLVILHGWPRRTSWPRLVGWILFTAAFNIAGLLTYLALNHTTVIKCGSCKKTRGLEIETCIRCGSELLAPETRQTDLILHS